MYDPDTEAGHMAEIFDEADGERMYRCRRSVLEREAYVQAKLNRFRHDQIGGFVVVRKPQMKQSTVETLYLADRAKTQRMWWTVDARLAIVFRNRDKAMDVAARLRYGQASVRRITTDMAGG